MVYTRIKHRSPPSLNLTAKYRKYMGEKFYRVLKQPLLKFISTTKTHCILEPHFQDCTVITTILYRDDCLNHTSYTDDTVWVLLSGDIPLENNPVSFSSKASVPKIMFWNTHILNFKCTSRLHVPNNMLASAFVTSIR